VTVTAVQRQSIEKKP